MKTEEMKRISETWKNVAKALRKVAETELPFSVKVSIETVFVPKEVEIFQDYYPDLSEENVMKIFKYCSNSGGLLNPLQLCNDKVKAILKL